MGIFKRIFTPSFVGTLSEKHSDKVHPNTPFRKIMEIRNANSKYDEKFEQNFGSVSHTAFLYICVTQNTSPAALKIILRQQMRNMSFHILVIAVFSFMLFDLLVDWIYVGLPNKYGSALILICIAISFISYLNSAHKAKQIAIGAIFPKTRMLYPKNHLYFNDGLYRLNKKELDPYVMTDEDFTSARKALEIDE
ncbi:hypothetical protein ACNO5E_08780 [Vibrio parahaemolyticus]|uniref:hypothetical protein n=1 Tax=Vibrio parahaemolyticus TaxID=670 RepID=UPI00081326B5|nr:hypothetical protein [Vibrio parahaemolyticus]OCP68284.1 hypothetical protein AKH08_15820 [Vibrio parahaemolyticus]